MGAVRQGPRGRSARSAKSRIGTGQREPVKVRTLIIVVVIIIGVALLVSNGLVGAGVCVKGLGCASASAHTSTFSSTNQVTIRTP
jgi:hypothetical protein